MPNLTTEQNRAIWQEGFDARHSSAADNYQKVPYDSIVDSARYRLWIAGWQAACARIDLGGAS